MAIDTIIEKIDVRKDFTTRLSCRNGFFAIWFSWPGRLNISINNIQIKDIWELTNGDFITITNRIEDIPAWFRFHPSEVKNKFSRRLIDQFNKGEYPASPIDRTNVWRPKTGDRVVLYKIEDSIDGDSILAYISFYEESLLIGENTKKGLDDLMNFGMEVEPVDEVRKFKMASKAKEKVIEMGLPREFSTFWKIG